MRLRTHAAVLFCVATPWIVASAQRPASAADTQTIVFVCEHGTVKSVLALTLFEQQAREARIPYRAVSRGTAPDSALPPFMRTNLRADGLSLLNFTPTRFTERDVMSAALVVSFDQPSVSAAVGNRAPLLAWNSLPSVTANYPVARDSIKHRVARLVDSLARATRARPAQGGVWPQHSMDRPQPPVVRPGQAGALVPAPADAIVLFDGTSLANWTSTDSARSPARWKVASGYMEVTKGTGGIMTKAGFGDAQLHVEWMSPSPAEGTGQDRGNSGVFLMGRYEVQVLDSHNNKTYADGSAGSIYGQFPPLVNASRPPGEWQTYDIVFHAPRFDASGKLVSPARMTVLHNGILVQDNMTLLGPTSHMRRAPYEAHPDKLPISLQDHGHPVRYRNIWIRPLTPDPVAP